MVNNPETRARIRSILADFMAAALPPRQPRVELDPDRCDLPNGKIAFKVYISPELAARIASDSLEP